ncbi:hypothetical protein DFH07DRAFT_1016289 [Mycena maculata]|uniref:Uncharacterized protein n=1 Tax=Mycena maculata TaxID=230809 RepID=A0AAD7JK74_9AGAR|nr:hypothetical protein DFH07DRAFT_1016289 [Mycena maculata]
MATPHPSASAVSRPQSSRPQQASTILSDDSFPDELLVEIATAAVQEDRRLADEFRAGLTLSHLSYRFRDIIIGTPTLWTVIKAELLVEGSVELLKLYLERSRACKIWVTLRELSDSDYRRLIAADLSHVLPHVNRIWRQPQFDECSFGCIPKCRGSRLGAPRDLTLRRVDRKLHHG